ncbi:GntR family transcriptional regulator [Erysipelothrix rhusiopathiae]|uniref:GntR family transcriptional regulator n=1 Tax=Erysipelothrix rhusiopathiae TaxID=1648 RepID=UPI002B24AD6B|nr:GntR family transcriptional regulator [Erysipelothrix rhusiopathiae]WRB93249.1 GntR family transcriptional regulator [Erysipelothrix rhusiopathiae]
MFTINTRNATPIFEQIIQQVGKFIAMGILQPHEQLPTVRSLAKDLGVNPNTVSKAYHECEMNGLIYSIPGKGSFVSEHEKGVSNLVSDAYQELTAIYHKLLELGETQETILNILKESHNDTIH